MTAAYATTDPHAATIALLAAARRRGPLAGDTAVIAVDGPSGAGKTSLALRVVAALADLTGQEPAVIHMDDLYPGWDGLAQAVPLLAQQVLAPLAEHRPAAYPRYDWERGRYGENQPVPAAPWLVIEGVGAGSRECAAYLSGLVWVHAPSEVRRRRGLDRDGEAYRPHWERWARQERALFAAERTRERADVVLNSAGAEPGEPLISADVGPQD